MWKIYELPLGPKKAEFYVNTWVGGCKMTMDGIDCATGKPFTPPKLPKWAYIFMVAFLALAALGGVTGVSCNENFSVPVRILIDLGILIACVAVDFGIAFLIAGAIYGI